MTRRTVSSALCLIAAAWYAGCGSKSPSSPTNTTAHLTAPAADSPSNDQQLDNLRPTLTVKNGTSDVPNGARMYEFQVADNSGFNTASTTTTLAGFAVVVGKTGVPEGTGGKTSFTPDADLQPTTRYYWRARVVQGTSQSDWSPTATFKTKLVGYNRAGELYDPLIFGETVGDRIGSTDFIPGQGIRLNNNTSYVRYLLPQSVTNGEFSMEVQGLRPNAPGDKSKVMGMQQGQDDFITNLYRVDIQYRGASGFPPNAITFRALYGNDTTCKFEPSTAVRLASPKNLDPSTIYYWRARWGSEFNLFVREGSADGTGATMYNQTVASQKCTYAPSPQYAYLGAPTGRSGAESASIPGSIYRNVWLANHPRPSSLGSALSAR